jgi:hypothetical protein
MVYQSHIIYTRRGAFIITVMSDTTLADLNRQSALQDQASAFVVAQLARQKLGALVYENDMLMDFLLRRKSIPRSIHPLVTKAAVAPIDLSSGLAPPSPLERAFLAQVDRVSPLGQIGGITVDASVVGTIQTGNATAYWAGEQTSKPVSSIAFSSAPLRPLKLISQIVMSEELAGLSMPRALPITQRALVSVQAAAEATASLDPTSTAIADVRPASLTAGLTPITPSGDFANNVGQVLAAISGGNPTRPVVVVSLQTAVRMQAALRDLASIGVRVVISSAAGNRIIGIDADGLLVVEGGAEIVKGTPDLQMSDSPDSPPTSATTLVSLWSRNLVALKTERWINWVARPGAVATLTLA